jgi:RraA family protein
MANRRLPAEIVEEYREHDVAMVSDTMNRLYTMTARIKPLTPASTTILGQACTVKVFPGDNLLVHKALDILRPGEVLVVDAMASDDTAVMGDLVAHKFLHRGAAGFVIDGVVRDIDGIRKAGLPLFACGVTVRGPLQRGPGEINYPVQCGGVVVQPGDIIYGDASGVVVIPRGSAEDLLVHLRGRSARERDYVAAVYRGDFSTDWVQQIVTDIGCSVDNEDEHAR